VGRSKLVTLATLILAILAMIALRRNSAALAGATGVVPFLYALSLFLTGFHLFRSGNRQPVADAFPKAFAGIHLIMLGLFAPLWLGADAGSAPVRVAVLVAPIPVYIIWALMQFGRHAGRQDRLVALMEIFVPQRMARLLAAELRILTMGLFAWGPRRRRADQPGFTSGSILAPVLISVAVLSTVEILIVHLIVGQWSPFAATILTALGLFTLVYIIGLAKSLKYMPTVLMPHTLLVRLGHFQVLEIPYDAIAGVRKVAGASPPPKSFNLALMSAPNLLIELFSDREAIGIGGKKRVFRNVAVRMDDAVGFEARLCDRLKSRASDLPIETGSMAGTAVTTA
jgi:hypothetical protein